MSWLLSPLLFRKSCSKTVNIAHIKKALVQSQPIFKPKNPRLSSQDWFLYSSIHGCFSPGLQRAAKAQRQCATRLFARYRPSGYFSLPKKKGEQGWCLVVPGQLQDELWRGRPNCRQRRVRRRLSAVDGPLQKVHPKSGQSQNNWVRPCCILSDDTS